MPEHSRRTVVRGAAWSVPLIVVAAQAPAFATSHDIPPPPGVDIDSSCANVGAAKKGCGVGATGTVSQTSADNTLQVPVTVVNNSLLPIVFQVTSMYTTNNGPANTAPTATTPGATSGIRGIVGTDISFSGGATAGDCTQTTASPNCSDVADGGLTNGSVVVEGGETAYFFVISNSTGSASNFQASITTRLLDATTCALIPGTAATTETSGAISSGNCR